MTCHKHEDCVEGLYCHDTNEWPLKSVCLPYREDNAECEEDYQCPITHFCWYKSKQEKESNVKRCMEMYSQETGIKFGWHQENAEASLDDYTQNGKFCQYGLAFQSDSNEA